jgi:glycolate oxidase iron-sulfur subunit
MAEQLGARKAAAIAGVEPDIVVTGNIGCMVQIAAHLGRPVVHTVEMLDWATGGPRPAALEGIALPDRPVRRTETAVLPPAGGAIW